MFYLKLDNFNSINFQVEWGGVDCYFYLEHLMIIEVHNNVRDIEESNF